MTDYSGRPPAAEGSTWLLVGSDSRQGLTVEQQQALATGGDTGNGRTDTIMLVHVPAVGSSAPTTLVSVPRDSYVPIPGYGRGYPEDMIDASLAPRAGEHLIKNGRGANKFYNSDLEAALKAKGITTVIVTGTSAQGAVAGPTQGATERGYKAIVPVDGMSAEDAYNEQYAAWHLAKGGPVALVEHVTVTRSDLIKFGN